MPSGWSLPGEAAESKCKARLQLVKNRGDPTAAASEAPGDQIQIRGGFYFKLEIRLAGTNKTRVKAKLFLLTFLFSHPWGATKRAERLCHPSLPWFDVRVAAESRICCAELSANLARLSPKRFTIF